MSLTTSTTILLDAMVAAGAPPLSLLKLVAFWAAMRCGGESVAAESEASDERTVAALSLVGICNVSGLT